MLTVSAAVRLIPRPPALVLNRKAKISELQGGDNTKNTLSKAHKQEHDSMIIEANNHNRSSQY